MKLLLFWDVNKVGLVKSIILNILNARPEESTRVFLLLGQGFFTGLFLATYDVGAVSVFLEHFSESTLAWAFVASGVTGIVFTYAYSFFQARISFPALVTSFLTIIAVANLFVWYGLTNFTNFEPIVFVAFVLALPFSYIGLLIFWGTFGRLFTMRQAKRIIGGIDTGQLIASIIALFIIGYLLDNLILVANDLFLISLFSLSGLFIFIFIITSKYPTKAVEATSRKSKTYPFIKMMQNRYLRLMATFVIISMIAATFVDFTFLNAIKIQWNNEASDIGAFVARFEAAVVIFSFLFQTFVTDYMIENYGLKISLLVNPLLIIVLTIICGVIGLININSAFVWFFLAISITKLFIDSLKDALDGPTFKLYFLPIDSQVRFDVSTKIEGMVTAFASMVAGLLLISLNAIKVAFDLELNLMLLAVVFILVPILIAWFFTTGSMHINYKKTLQDALALIKGTGIKQKPSYKEVIDEDNVKNNESAVYYSLKLMQKLEPGAFENSLDSISSHILPNGRLATLRDQVMHEATTMKELASQAMASVVSGGGKTLTNKDLYELSKAPSTKKKIAAAIHLRESITDDNVFVLLDLLRDFSPQVRLEAIKTARIVKRDEAWNLVAELLDNKTFANEAAAALVAGGNDALPMVNQLFNKSDKSRASLLLAVKVMSDVSSHVALEFLWEKLEFPDRKIVREVLVTLQRNKVKAIDNKIERVYNQLDLEIAKAIWNMASMSELKETEANQRLLESIQREINSNFEFIYIYLSLLYDQASIQLVKDNIESGTSDGITYAIELLDIFIDKELRPKLYPLIEDSSIKEKLEKLQIFFPRITFDELQTLNYVINRDYNMINRWTKACALDSLLAQPNATINAGLIGHLFNPDLLMAENAAKVIKKIDENKFYEVVDRLPDDRKYYLINKFRQNDKNEHIGRFPMRFDRICHILKIGLFGDISGIHVSELIDKFQVIKTKAGNGLNLDRVKGNNHLVFVDTGSIEIAGETTTTINEDQVFTKFFFDTLSMSDVTITSTTDSIVYLLELSDYLTIMINYKELARETMGSIEQFEVNRSAIAV